MHQDSQCDSSLMLIVYLTIDRNHWKYTELSIVMLVDKQITCAPLTVLVNMISTFMLWFYVFNINRHHHHAKQCHSWIHHFDIEREWPPAVVFSVQEWPAYYMFSLIVTSLLYVLSNSHLPIMFCPIVTSLLFVLSNSHLPIICSVQ